jgi:hypothetical protein
MGFIPVAQAQMYDEQVVCPLQEYMVYVVSALTLILVIHMIFLGLYLGPQLIYLGHPMRYFGWGFPRSKTELLLEVTNFYKTIVIKVAIFDCNPSEVTIEGATIEFQGYAATPSSGQVQVKWLATKFQIRGMD